MLNVLKKILGIRATDRPNKPTNAILFTELAYFSNRVPSSVTQKWVVHGGKVCSGTTLDVRARYFFAMDPGELWVTKLFAKSVVVIHAGWIVHCVDEAFRVPIAEYILDDRFVPGPPYKRTNEAVPIYIPLSDPVDSSDTESIERGLTLIQTSDTPSTPTTIPRKRKREQAYFDSPSGSLVYSGFDKYGMPRRPRKQRKLRFDPSFSPKGGRSSKDVMQATVFDWNQDGGRSRGSRATSARCGLGRTISVRSPDTPDKPLAYEGPKMVYRDLSVDARLAQPGITRKEPPVRTIDFTNLPPPTRRFRFPDSNVTKSENARTALSVVKSTDDKVKTPKKISFADHARVCVYALSPQRQDTKDDAASGSERPCMDQVFKEEPELDAKTWTSSNRDPDGSATQVINGSHRFDHYPGIEREDDPARLVDGDPLKDDENDTDTLTLTTEQVHAMRCRLVESAAKNDTSEGQLATLFELGKTFRGKEFRHVW